MKYGDRDKMFEFKLFSASSFFSFVRLFIVTFPALVLPHYLVYGGPCEEEYKKSTGEKYDMKFPSGLNELHEAEFYINFLIYVLPFALVYNGIEHFSTLYDCQMEFFNMLSEKPSLINVRHVLLPIVGFLLFAVGKLLTLFGLGSTMDFIDKGLYLNVFTNSCYFFLAHLPLHFLLAMYEQYLYQNFNIFQLMCRSTLNTFDQKTLFKRAEMLPRFMEATQRGFGFFLLVDITLMLIFWLIHLYHAYFTFQVKIKKKWL